MIFLAGLFFASSVYANDPLFSGFWAEISAAQIIGTDGAWQDLSAGIGYDSALTGLSWIAVLSAQSDGKYDSFFDEDHVGGFAYFLEAGGITYTSELFTLRAGRFSHFDVVENPYSLFVSSLAIPAFLYEIDYRGNWLRFLTRSVELTRNSEIGYPDRSIVFKTLAITQPNWEFGFQDAIVAVAPTVTIDGVTSPPPGDGSGPVFVPEYFFNPIPAVFTQYTLGGGKSPWVQRINHNSLMGFYGLMRGETPSAMRWDAVAQWLVDDVNLNAIVNPDSPHQNPNKWAWLIAARLSTPYGAFRFSHAGAHMYTFQTSGHRRYEYTYYPDVLFPRGGGLLDPIDYRDNYFGFYLGENTAAFKLDWEWQIPRLPVPGAELHTAAALSYTVSGSKSPSNPWHEHDSWRDPVPDGRKYSTRFLDEDILEHGALLTLEAEWRSPLGPGRYTVGLRANFGHWWNVLRLESVDGDPVDRQTGLGTALFPGASDVEIYRPSNENYGLAQIEIYASYRFSR
ncbi:MAG: hypothetical protein EA426_12230 [Spirochaetaceae bacterium]|nr:MAG: hypothetical protein EA426_12230 [Spirochaetaceae bacterium]